MAGSGNESGRKTLAVLLCFSPARPEWTVADIVAELRLSSATVYRHIGLLRESGLVAARGGGAYRLTAVAESLGEAARHSHQPVVDVAVAAMARLRDEVDETVLLAVRSGDHALAVRRLESRSPVPLRFVEGRPMPMHQGALGRVLLADLTAEERGRYLHRCGYDVGVLRHGPLSSAALDAVATAGFAESFEEIDTGVWGVAAPVRRNGRAVGAVGVAAPLARTDAQRRGRILTLLLEAVREIQRHTGAAMSHQE